MQDFLIYFPAEMLINVHVVGNFHEEESQISYKKSIMSFDIPRKDQVHDSISFTRDEGRNSVH